MPRILKQYFLPWFAVLVLLMGLDVVIGNGSRTLSEMIVFALCIPALMTFLFLGLRQLVPGGEQGFEKQKLTKQFPLTPFLEAGFNKKKKYLVGEVEGYTVLLKLRHRGIFGKPVLSTWTLFDAYGMERGDYDAMNQQLLTENMRVEENFLYHEWELALGMPDFEKIMNKVRMSVEFLQKNGKDSQSLSASKNIRMNDGLATS